MGHKYTRRPPRRKNRDHEHDWQLHQFSPSHTQNRDYPKYPDVPKHEASRKHERKIQNPSFENLQDTLARTRALEVVYQLAQRSPMLPCAISRRQLSYLTRTFYAPTK